jgi:hypothetical protein
VLLEGTTSSIIGDYGLESGHMSKARSNLLISIVYADRGFHPFHMRTEVFQSAALLPV